MNRKRFTAIFIFVVALTFSIAVPAHAQNEKVDANRARAEELWEEAIRAKGGRERLHSIENYLVSSTIHVEALRGGHTTEAVWLYALPGKAWLYEYETNRHFEYFMTATVLNLGRNFCFVTLAPAIGDIPKLSHCLPTVPAEKLIQNSAIYLMETKWVKPVPLRTREARTGRKRVDVVETEIGKLRVDFYLDRKTHLPIKIVTDQYHGISEMITKLGLTVFLDDYVTVDGIKMPRSVVREPSDQLERVRRDLEFASYRFNVDHEEKIFNYPAPRNVKAGSWKRRSKS